MEHFNRRIRNWIFGQFAEITADYLFGNLYFHESDIKEKIYIFVKRKKKNRDFGWFIRQLWNVYGNVSFFLSKM